MGYRAGIVLILYYRQRKARYDMERNRAILDGVRSSIENQIYGLNERLVQNEERWKDVNHLLIRNEYLHNGPSNERRRTYHSDFLRSNGISENDLLIDERLVFILTSFHSNYLSEYETIRQICVDAGLKPYRGDEEDFKSDIFPSVLKLIVKSKLVIANINGRSPNVFYELGIAHALDKKVILLSRSLVDLPIDLKSKRFLIYSSISELNTLLRNELIAS